MFAEKEQKAAVAETNQAKEMSALNEKLEKVLSDSAEAKQGSEKTLSSLAAAIEAVQQEIAQSHASTKQAIVDKEQKAAVEGANQANELRSVIDKLASDVKALSDSSAANEAKVATEKSLANVAAAVEALQASTKEMFAEK